MAPIDCARLPSQLALELGARNIRGDSISLTHAVCGRLCRRSLPLAFLARPNRIAPLIGWLDGAQAQHLRVDPTPDRNSTLKVTAAYSERIPWLDAAYHDRFILHGAVIQAANEGGLDATALGIYSEDYISTEVLTGHPAMVANAFLADLVRKYWLTT